MCAIELLSAAAQKTEQFASHNRTYRFLMVISDTADCCEAVGDGFCKNNHEDCGFLLLVRRGPFTCMGRAGASGILCAGSCRQLPASFKIILDKTAPEIGSDSIAIPSRLSTATCFSCYVLLETHTLFNPSLVGRPSSFTPPIHLSLRPHHPARTMDTSHHTAPSDLEKGVEAINVSSEGSSTTGDLSPLPVHLPEAITKWDRWIKSLRGLEARGITRVLPEERKVPSRLDYAQVSILWFSANVTANNLAVGLLGPLLFQLGFLDSALIATFASFVGSLGPAYMSIWGAQSGNRTMVRLPRCAPEHDCMDARRTNQGKIDCRSLLHGLLAVEAHHGAEYHHHGWLRRHQLHPWRSNPLRRQRG